MVSPVDMLVAHIIKTKTKTNNPSDQMVHEDVHGQKEACMLWVCLSLVSLKMSLLYSKKSRGQQQASLDGQFARAGANTIGRKKNGGEFQRM